MRIGFHLEDPQFILVLTSGGLIQNVQLEAFGDYSVTRVEVDRYGLRLLQAWKKAMKEAH